MKSTENIVCAGHNKQSVHVHNIAGGQAILQALGMWQNFSSDANGNRSFYQTTEKWHCSHALRVNNINHLRLFNSLELNWLKCHSCGKPVFPLSWALPGGPPVWPPGKCLLFSFISENMATQTIETNVKKLKILLCLYELIISPFSTAGHFCHLPGIWRILGAFPPKWPR